MEAGEELSGRVRYMLSPVFAAWLFERARLDAPKEACGLFKMGHSVLYGFIQVENISPDPEHEFRMRCPDVPMLRNEGIWHSHPTTRPHLSRPDEDLMRHYDVPMVIVGVQHPTITLYRLEAGKVRECARWNKRSDWRTNHEQPILQRLPVLLRQ